MDTLLLTLAALFILGIFLHKPLSGCAKRIPFCTPVGLAVTLVWITLLALYLIGQKVDPTVLATVMGGSLMVYAFMMERRNPRTAVVMLLAAIIITYAILNERWWLLAGGVVILGIFWIAIVKKPVKKLPESTGVDRG